MAILARIAPRRALLAAALLCSLLATRAVAQTPDVLRPLSEDEAKKLMPRAPNLAALTDAQRGVLFDVAGDTFDYAGCNSTLAACLRADVKDKHAVRMIRLAEMLIQAGYTDTQVKFFLDQYYGSFAKDRRKKVRSDDCPIEGDAKAPITMVEFSDYQCPHCARAARPIHEFVESMKGKVKFCSKYFPLPGHPRAMQAAATAEYARLKGKFWQMHELLFAEQEHLEDADLKSYAQRLGLDGDELLKQIYSGKLNEVIERHKKEAMDLGVESTPSVFFDGRLLTLPGMQFLGVSAEDELEWQHNGGAWDKE